MAALAMFSWLLASSALAATQVDPTLRVVAEQRYDDDALLAGTPAGPLPGQFMTKLSPQLGARLRAPLWTVHTWYALDAMYRQNTGSTQIDHRGALEAQQTVSRRLRLSFDARVYRVTDPTSLPRIGVARTFAPVLYGRATASALYQASEQLQLRPHVTAEGAQVFEGAREPGFLFAPAVEGWYLRSPRTSFGAEVRFQLFTLGSSAARGNGVFGLYRYRLSRPMTLTVRAGPIFYAENGGGPSGIVPRVVVELAREHGRTELGLALGNDLVGASGFDNALWAQFVSALASHRVSGPLRVYARGSYYRNGLAPGAGLSTLVPSLDGSHGYAAEGGLEFRINRFVSLSGAFTRIAQVGSEEVNLSRNIAAVRLNLSNVE